MSFETKIIVFGTLGILLCPFIVHYSFVGFFGLLDKLVPQKYFDVVFKSKCPRCKEFFDYEHFFRGPSPNSFYACSKCNKRYYYCESDKRLKNAAGSKYDHNFNFEKNEEPES